MRSVSQVCLSRRSVKAFPSVSDCPLSPLVEKNSIHVCGKPFYARFEQDGKNAFPKDGNSVSCHRVLSVSLSRCLP